MCAGGRDCGPQLGFPGAAVGPAASTTQHLCVPAAVLQPVLLPFVSLPISVLVPEVTATFTDNMDTPNKSLHVKLPPNGMSNGIYTGVAESGV